MPTDVTQDAAVEALVEQTVGELGRLDLLVTAAGWLVRTGQWRQARRLGRDAGREPARGHGLLPGGSGTDDPPASRHDRERGVGGGGATHSGCGRLCRDQGRCRGLEPRLAEELWGEGVRVGVIVPGAVDTPLWDAIPNGPIAGGCSLDDVARVVVLMATLPVGATLEETTILPAGGIL